MVMAARRNRASKPYVSTRGTLQSLGRFRAPTSWIFARQSDLDSSELVQVREP
jgi:hypothetical protein